MRPIRLQLKGFTAFRDEQVLDFEALDLFAVVGPTGSGKSSLLDAITYALYGTVPRVGNRAGQLISQGQPRMSVLFEFDVEGDRYRVSRSTPVKGASTILLERRAGTAWHSYGEGADRIRDAGTLIEDLIGLDYPAFTHSVLLPQGRFAEFLTGDPKERRDILTELLGLELFERMARRARELSAATAARSQAKAEVLADQFTGVDEDALHAAKALAGEAEARCDALARAEQALGRMSKEWARELRRAEALQQLAGEASDVALEAGRLATGLEALDVEVRQAQGEAAAALKEAHGQAAEAEASRAALQDAERRLGSLESLAALRASLDELARARQRLQATAASALEAAAMVEARRRVDREARTAADATAAAVEEAEKAQEEAEEAHARAHRRNLVGALTRGLKPGDRCPVCDRPLSEVPTAEAKELQVAVHNLEMAREAARRAGRLWSKADRDASAAERDLGHATADLERCEQQRADSEREWDELSSKIAQHFGMELPDGAAALVESRIDEVRALSAKAEEMARSAAEAAMGASAARERATLVAGKTTELAARLRALPVGRLLQLGRAQLPDLEAPPTLMVAFPGDAAAVEEAALSLADGAAGLGMAFQAGAAESRSSLDALMNQAQSELPSEIRVPAGADLDDLLNAARTAARRAIAEVASAQKDVRRLAEQLAVRRNLEREVAGLAREAEILRSLAAELRADRLMGYLQGEALELLAAAGSDRLQFLSQDRYRLIFDGDEFYVEDRQNGDERRSVRTLSGGETFLASLALALALSEQIQELAVTPRARLESLFIDEGFGALDQDSLEVTTEALGQLGGAERMVGVITHVRDLADRLPVQIEVERQVRGSAIKPLRADSPSSKINAGIPPAPGTR